MEQERTPRERALDLIRLLVGVESDWEPAPYHYLWVIRITAAGTLSVVVLILTGDWVWGILVDYIQPKTATQRKDIANIFVVIAVGVIGTLTAIAALGNLYISRRNLQNAREALRKQSAIADERAQDEALQAYLYQIGELLLEKGLRSSVENKEEKSEEEKSVEARVLARALTLTVLRLLNPARKTNVVQFLMQASVVQGPERIIPLSEADLSGANLNNAYLSGIDLHDAKLIGANLSGADLSGANLNSVFEVADLSGADLSGASLSGAALTRAILKDADLEEANLEGAELSGADLSRANLRGAYDGFNSDGSRRLVANEKLEEQAESLEGATMPDGTIHP